MRKANNPSHSLNLSQNNQSEDNVKPQRYERNDFNQKNRSEEHTSELQSQR